MQARGMCLVLDIVLNHVQPTTGSASVATVSPFNSPEHYHMYNASVGESFDSYARHPVSSLKAFGPACGPGDYNCSEGYNERQMLDGWFCARAATDQKSRSVRGPSY